MSEDPELLDSIIGSSAPMAKLKTVLVRAAPIKVLREAPFNISIEVKDR